MSEQFLYIYCEGETEQETLKSFLRHYWSERFVDCDVIKYEGAGGLKVNFAIEANRTFKTEPESSVLCLVDLYREPFEVYNRSQMTHEEGFLAVQQQLLAQIEPQYIHRFGAFPVVMEPETWLLADPKIQSRLSKSYPAPESIEHPVKELQIWRKNYNKRIDGKNLFGEASAKRVYDDNCPHFKAIVEWLSIEPEKLKDPIVDQLSQWSAPLQKLQLEKSQALIKSDSALKNGDLDEAIKWEEHSKAIDKQIEEYAKTYYQNFE